MSNQNFLSKFLCLAAFVLGAAAAQAQTPFYKLATTSLLEGNAAGSDSVTFAVYPITNTWTATADAAWIHLSTNFTSGVGGTNVVFSFDTNAGPTRSGTLTIQGMSVTVTQVGSNYVYANPTTLLFTNSVATTLAVDSSGNVYIGDGSKNTNNLTKWSAGTGKTTVLLSNYNSLSALTMDNSQNLMFTTPIANSGGYWNVSRYTLSTGQVSNLLQTTFSNPLSMCMDLSNVVYVADYTVDSIKVWTGSGGFYPQNWLGIVPGSPAGIAVDLLGNLYVAGFSTSVATSAAYKWNPNISYYPVDISPPGEPPRYIWEPTNIWINLANASLPKSTAVDTSGNAYIGSYELGLVKWNAATGHLSKLATNIAATSIVLDSANNIYIADYVTKHAYEIPNAYIDPTPKYESAAAGQDMLNPVIPSTFNLGVPFAPASDSSWLKINSTASGWIYFSFTANTNVARTAHISLLGQSIPVTQQGVTPPVLTGLKYSANGSCQFSFTNVPGKTFRVVASPDLSVPFANWTVLGHATNISGTTYQFTSKPGANEPAMFYGLRWP